MQNNAASLHINKFSRAADKQKEQNFLAEQVHELSGTQSIHLYHLS